VPTEVYATIAYKVTSMLSDLFLGTAPLLKEPPTADEPAAKKTKTTTNSS
jgi:hypothetical protein